MNDYDYNKSLYLNNQPPNINYYSPQSNTDNENNESPNISTNKKRKLLVNYQNNIKKQKNRLSWQKQNQLQQLKEKVRTTSFL